MEFWLAQIFGGVALILVCISYFLKSKPKFLIFQAVADIFYAGAFFVVDANVGAAITVISIFRCIYIYFADKNHFKHTLSILPIFIILYLIATIVFWQGPLDIIPLITGSLFTLAFTIKNLQVMRYVLILPNILIIIYNSLSTTYISAVLDSIEVFVLLIAIIQYHKNNNKNNIKKDTKV